MYEDFAGDYNKTVLGDYKYTAHTVISGFVSAELPKRSADTEFAILDLGCGTGLSSAPFFKLGKQYQITGIDLTPAMLEQAKKAGPYRKLICQVRLPPPCASSLSCASAHIVS
jgi:predicted TPR repeat methyltransferase